MDNIVLVVTIIGVLGVGAQWCAWRFNLPAIVLMATAGILAGPVLGFLHAPPGAPDGAPPMQALFGEFYRPIIAIAVAIILFEGGLSLRFSEIRGLSTGVRRLVLPGVPIAWALGALAARQIGDLSWSSAILFSGIMVVTGPTVIVPLLRQSRLKQRPAALLKWEAIINDPIGALLAVVAYEGIVFRAETSHEFSSGQILGSLALAAILSVAFGVLLARFAASSFRRGWIPEYLKPPVLLVLVLVCFEMANLLQDEAGLLAVTAMGVTLANSKVASIDELRLFKENIAVLLVSGVFIMLTANLTGDMLHGLGWRDVAFVAAMLFVVRPLTVIISTIGAGLPWQERLLVAWIAPRGIVAVAISSFFGAALVGLGVEDGARLIPLAFVMVFVTVVLHGFTIGPMARALGLASRERPGVLIVGATPWSAELAGKLKEMKIPVMVADSSWRRLRAARLANVETYYGEILSEVTEHHLDLNRFGTLLAVSGNEAHNALVCTDLAPELGRAAIYQINARGKDEEDRRALSYTLQGRTLLHSGATLDELLRRHYAGWIYQRTRLSEEYPPEKYLEDLGDEYDIVLALRKGVLLFASMEARIKPEIGDTILAYIPKPSAAKPDERKTSAAEGKAKAEETPAGTAAKEG
ncbi:MAG: sodium:proton antiporter [Parvularculaceae bacterium]|nr:sodium:proton antiporter [Amphiplicatus sp.]MCB9955512.1 sodium:proton antiporter [Caulobacterales bacterium]